MSAAGAPLRVLYVTPELAPLAKAGGLGDVAEALPPALAALGTDLRTLVPAYPALLAAYPDARVITRFDRTLLGGAFPDAELVEAHSTLWLLDCKPCYARPGGIYQNALGVDWPDNAIRYGLLSRVAALLGSAHNPLAWKPDIVHANDWQTGLAPAYLALQSPAAPRAATILTIHNLAYQGVFGADTLEALALPRAAFTFDGLEFHGRLSFLKAGLQYADALSTVSPTYAREILGAELGFGLDGVLRYRSDRLTGILNGIDTATWDPARDPHLVAPFDVRTLDRKAANTVALRAQLGLAPQARGPLFGMVARLVEQKGADLIAEVLPDLIAAGGQFALLGSGDKVLEARFHRLADLHPGSVAVRIGFDEALAHRIEAGADVFLMPSRFEPCGLNQFYSMRYGTLPVVHRTGGLADSVIDETDPAGGNGFVIDRADPAALREAVLRAVRLYPERIRWRALQVNGMKREFGWQASAKTYLDLYARARSGR